MLAPENVASIPSPSSVAGGVLVRLLGAVGTGGLVAGPMIPTVGSLHAGLLTDDTRRLRDR